MIKELILLKDILSTVSDTLQDVDQSNPQKTRFQSLKRAFKILNNTNLPREEKYYIMLGGYPGSGQIMLTGQSFLENDLTDDVFRTVPLNQRQTDKVIEYYFHNFISIRISHLSKIINDGTKWESGYKKQLEQHEKALFIWKFAIGKDNPKSIHIQYDKKRYEVRNQVDGIHSNALIRLLTFKMSKLSVF